MKASEIRKLLLQHKEHLRDFTATSKAEVNAIEMIRGLDPINTLHLERIFSYLDALVDLDKMSEERRRELITEHEAYIQDIENLSDLSTEDLQLEISAYFWPDQDFNTSEVYNRLEVLITRCGSEAIAIGGIIGTLSTQQMITQ